MCINPVNFYDVIYGKGLRTYIILVWAGLWALFDWKLKRFAPLTIYILLFGNNISFNLEMRNMIPQKIPAEIINNVVDLWYIFAVIGINFITYT